MPRYRLNEAELAKLPPEEQAEVRADMLAIEARLRANPLENFHPHLKQRQILDATSPIRLFAGGNRSGKTTIGVVDCLIQTLDLDMVPEHLRRYRRHSGPFHMRVILADLVDTWSLTMKPKILEWCPPAAFRGGSFEKAYSQQFRVLHFANGSSWHFMSHEQETLKMGGAALHRIFYDEEPPKEVRDENQMRLIDFNGDELFTMTPLKGLTWMYDDIYLKAASDPSITVVEVDIDENPHVNAEARDRILGSYSTLQREARKSGKFVSFAGLIYKTFDPARHVIPQAEPPRAVDVYTAIDPGLRYMCGVLWGYLTPDDDLVIFDELAAREMTIGQVCHDLLLRNKAHGITPRWNVIDPAAKIRDKQTGRSDQEEFARNGVHTILGNNPVIPGISAVTDRLNGTKDLKLVGRVPPRLFIMDNCTELIRQISRYRWKSQAPSREPEEDDHRARPVKKDDHLPDALRYLVMSRPLAPQGPPPPDARSAYEKLLEEDRERSARLSTVGHPQGNVYA